MRVITALLLLAGTAAAQGDYNPLWKRGFGDGNGGGAFRLQTGTAAPSSGDCDAAAEAGRLYLRTDNPATANSTLYKCQKTGASSWAWMPASHSVQDAAPAKCAVGELWFDSNAAAGQNWYGCTAADTWTLLGMDARTIDRNAAVCQAGAAAGGFSHTSTANAYPAATCVTGSNSIYGVLQFSDSYTQSIQDRFNASAVTSLSVRLVVRTAATSGNSKFCIALAKVASGASGDPSWGSDQCLTIAADATTTEWVASTLSLTLPASTAAGDTLLAKITRDPADAADTVGAAVDLISVVWTVQ